MAAYRLVRAQHGLPVERSSVPVSSAGREASQDQDQAEAQSPSAESFSSPISSPSPFGFVNIDMTMTTIGHLALFNQHVQKSNLPVEWVYLQSDPSIDPSIQLAAGAQGSQQLISPNMIRGMKTTPIWSVQVLVDGQCLGMGKGGTKKVARNEAAKRGLRNMGIYVW